MFQMTADIVIGICCNDFVMMASDTMKSKSYVFLKDDLKKIHNISDHSVIAVMGDGAHALQISSYISSNLHLYQIQNGYFPSAEASANFARQSLVTYMKNLVKVRISVLIASYDKQRGAELFLIDSLGNSHSVKYAGHGCASGLSNNILQSEWKPDLTRTQGHALLKKCICTVHHRLILNLRNFIVIMVDKDGVQEMEPITFNSPVPIEPWYF
ncbi:probable proteasome subunit beta type-2 [Drosophila willistoni]|uniref:probable proteasome subunit beta type-2 n=1 Tax=Drosophila willistoni TaxID=7260 RepID=UPI00017D7B32|nr:probable proteasome subunit beta type-2 [Drosophila willistoni]